jgi:hypothetical protein
MRSAQRSLDGGTDAPDFRSGARLILCCRARRSARRSSYGWGTETGCLRFLRAWKRLCRLRHRRCSGLLQIGLAVRRALLRDQRGPTTLIHALPAQTSCAGERDNARGDQSILHSDLWEPQHRRGTQPPAEYPCTTKRTNTGAEVPVPGALFANDTQMVLARGSFVG